MTVLAVKALPSYYDQLKEAKKRIDELEALLRLLEENNPDLVEKFRDLIAQGGT
jgi:hypothetical protein